MDGSKRAACPSKPSRDSNPNSPTWGAGTPLGVFTTALPACPQINLVSLAPLSRELLAAPPDRWEGGGERNVVPACILGVFGTCSYESTLSQCRAGQPKMTERILAIRELGPHPHSPAPRQLSPRSCAHEPGLNRGVGDA